MTLRGSKTDFTRTTERVLYGALVFQRLCVPGCTVLVLARIRARVSGVPVRGAVRASLMRCRDSSRVCEIRPLKVGVRYET